MIMRRRILIADDHSVLRQGLVLIINGQTDLVVAAEAGDAHALMTSLTKEKFDLLILDITMPGQSGLDLIGQVRSLYPPLPILVLSMHAEEEFALRCLKLGAFGYLTKGSSITEILSAIRRVLEGKQYVSPKVAELLALEYQRPQDKLPHEALSNREFDVLCRIASGKERHEIARDLGISVKTVSTYRENILEKMGLKKNSELIRYAIENRLMNIAPGKSS